MAGPSGGTGPPPGAPGPDAPAGSAGASPGRSAARSVARAGDAALPSLWELERPATLVVGGYGGIGGLTSGANLLERLNKEIKRRTDVVGVSPNPEALLRLAGSVLVEAYDEWQAGERRYLSEGSMTLLAHPSPDPKEVATPTLLKA